MSESKSAFRRRLGRLLRILHTGTLSSSGTTTTFICLPLTDFYGADSALNGASIYDTAAGEWRRCTAWLATTGTGTVNRAFTNAQVSARTINVFEQFTPDDLDDALQMALTEAYEYIPSRVVDTSLTVIANQYDYTIPSTIRDLSRMRGGKVEWQANTAVTTFPYVEFGHWEVRESGSTKTLTVDSVNGRVGRTIRLRGWGVIALPATDGSTLDLEEDTLQLLAYKAAEIIWRTGPTLTGRDAEFAAAMSGYYKKLFEDKKDIWGIEMNPTNMESPDGIPYVDAPLAYNHATPS